MQIHVSLEYLQLMLSQRRAELLEQLASQVCTGATQEAITAFAMESVQTHGALAEIEMLIAHPKLTPQSE